jgi:hypothetical protein
MGQHFNRTDEERKQSRILQEERTRRAQIAEETMANRNRERAQARTPKEDKNPEKPAGQQAGHSDPPLPR